MNLEMDFYRVADVANRWGVSVNDVLHQADMGRLVLSVSLLDKHAEIRRHREDGYSGTLMPEIPMMFDVPLWAARRIARTGRSATDELSCRGGMVGVEVVSDPLQLTVDDLWVTSQEIARFESKEDARLILAGQNIDAAIPASKQAEPETPGASSGALESDEQPARLMPIKCERGITKAEILEVQWPMPNGAPSLESILDKIPKYVDAACIKVGRPGKGRSGSHLWNPAMLAVCLATRTPHKNWTCRQKALTDLIRSEFSDYLEEWSKKQEML